MLSQQVIDDDRGAPGHEAQLRLGNAMAAKSGVQEIDAVVRVTRPLRGEGFLQQGQPFCIHFDVWQKWLQAMGQGMAVAGCQNDCMAQKAFIARLIEIAAIKAKAIANRGHFKNTSIRQNCDPWQRVAVELFFIKVARKRQKRLGRDARGCQLLLF